MLCFKGAAPFLGSSRLTLTPVAFPLRVAVGIAQKLLDKIDLRLSYVGRLGPRGKREFVYKFVAPDDERSGIFKQRLNRELVSVTNNIKLQNQVTDTISLPLMIIAWVWRGKTTSLIHGGSRLIPVRNSQFAVSLLTTKLRT
ncbi:hypothetical protein IQ244_25155 [Nostoc sp. LEGE 06077]|nr:hypothetical protein [Nostoc sp. LEGE 06077]